MKSSSIIGISLLVMAVGLAIYEPFLQKAGETPSASSEPTPYAAKTAGNGMTANPLPIAAAPDWDTQQPRHQPLPKRHHPVHHSHVVPHHKAATHKVSHANAAPITPLPAPTFLPSTPEPKTAPAPQAAHVISRPPAIKPEVPIEEYHPPIVHRAPKPRPTVYAPPTLSPQDLARQRKLERIALIDAATRSARGTVMSTVPNVHILSADAEDHGTYISVIVVEQRPTGTIVESFVFTPGPSALGLAQRRVISQNTADPYISH